MEKILEYRSADIPQVNEVDNQSTRISGYAAVFNSLSNDLGGFKEIIKRNAFTDSLNSDQEVMALFNHDWNMPLARKSAGTLNLKEDKQGLFYDFAIPPTTRGKDLAIDISLGNITGSSFAFFIPDNGDSFRVDKETGMIIREISAAILVDVSPVTSPAYPAASVSVRSFEAFKQCLDKEKGLSKEILRRKLKIMERCLNR